MTRINATRRSPRRPRNICRSRRGAARADRGTFTAADEAEPAPTEEHLLQRLGELTQRISALQAELQALCPENAPADVAAAAESAAAVLAAMTTVAGLSQRLEAQRLEGLRGRP